MTAKTGGDTSHTGRFGGLYARHGVFKHQAVIRRLCEPFGRDFDPDAGEVSVFELSR